MVFLEDNDTHAAELRANYRTTALTVVLGQLGYLFPLFSAKQICVWVSTDSAHSAAAFSLPLSLKTQDIEVLCLIMVWAKLYDVILISSKVTRKCW
jgi:hypothetical protein